MLQDRVDVAEECERLGYRKYKRNNCIHELFM